MRSFPDWPIYRNWRRQAKNRTSTARYFERFQQAMDDDFNTAKGIGILFDGIRQGNKLMDDGRNPLSSDHVVILGTLRRDLLQMGELLASCLNRRIRFLTENDPKPWLKSISMKHASRH